MMDSPNRSPRRRPRLLEVKVGLTTITLTDYHWKSRKKYVFEMPLTQWADLLATVAEGKVHFFHGFEPRTSRVSASMPCAPLPEPPMNTHFHITTTYWPDCGWTAEIVETELDQVIESTPCTPVRETAMHEAEKRIAALERDPARRSIGQACDEALQRRGLRAS